MIKKFLLIFLPLLAIVYIADLVLTKPSAVNVCETFINSINTGNFQQLDNITGQRFLDERVKVCEFYERHPDGVFGSERPLPAGVCKHPDVLKEWDKFVRGLNLYLAPCEYRDLRTTASAEGTTYAEATIVCGKYKDRFLLTREKDGDGWRLRGISSGSMYKLVQEVLLNKMVAITK